MNREQWLTRATNKLDRKLFQPLGKTMPKKWRVSCSWPSSRSDTSSGKGYIGQCFYPGASADGTTEMIISMSQDNPTEVLAILAHEMVHAVEGSEAGHKAPFKRTALAIGLEGKMTSTRPGEKFIQDVAPILKSLGSYPHAKVSINKEKKQTTRMIKLECTYCGFICRASRKALETCGIPQCACGTDLEVVL